MSKTHQDRQTRGTVKRTAKEWTALIASNLSGEQLDAFTAMLDETGGNDFYSHLNEINRKRNPHSYADL